MILDIFYLDRLQERERGKENVGEKWHMDINKFLWLLVVPILNVAQPENTFF